MKKQLILATILGAFASILAPLGANAQPAVPAQAAAAGFSSLVFDDEFTSNTFSASQGTTAVAGAKWYSFFWDGATASEVSISNGVLTLGNGCIGTTPTYAASTSTTSPIAGSYYHGYFEATCQFAGKPGSTSTWPSFWGYGTDAQSSRPSTTYCPECDFFEAYPVSSSTIYPCNTIHNWNTSGEDTANTGANNGMESLVGSTESITPSDGNYHTYGCLWTSTGAGTGKVQFYYDNYLVVHQGGITSFNVGAGTSLPGMEQSALTVILGGAANWPMNVTSVHVWQAGTSGSSGGSTGSTGTTTQTVSGFPSTLSLSTTQSPYTLPANTSASLALTYSVASGPASVSGDTLTLTGAGTVVLNATQAGNSTYAPYSGTETITVTAPGTQTVSGFPSTLSLSTTQSPYTLPTTTSAGLTISYKVASGPASVSGNVLTVTGSGTVVVDATQAGNSSYAAYSGVETITVTAPSTQTVSGFPSTLSLSTTQSPYALTSTTSAGLTISYSVASGPASVSGNTLTLTGPGTVVLNATQAGNTTYAAYSGTETITVTSPGTQTISGFTSTASLTMAQSPYALPATTTAGLTPTYSVTSGPATVSSNTLTLTGAGTVVLKATQAGNSTYSAYSATETITVSSLGQTVKALAASYSLTTSQSPYSFPADTDQGLPLRYTINSGPGTFSGNVLYMTGTGTVSLTAGQSGSAEYSSWSLNVTVTVSGLTAQTVTGFPSTLSLTMAQTPYTLPSTTSAGFTLSYSIVSGPASVSGNTLTLTGAGTVVLTASQAGNSSYAAYSGNEAITVTAVAQSVTGFPSSLSLTTGESPYTLPSTTSAGLTIAYSVTSGPATVSGHSLSLTGAGTVVVNASQGGNATYAAYSGSETIAVSALTGQTVSNFPTTQSVTLGSGAISLTAATSAGQTITYTVVSGPATISGDTLTITGSGTVVISASAGGTSTYAGYSGTETITVTSGATLTFAQWEAQPGFFTAAQVSNTAVSGPTATPENDGVPNLLKYVYDINPAVAMTSADYAALPATDVDTSTPMITYLTLTYRQYAKLTGVTIQVQTSPDLQTWTTVTPSISHQTSTDPNTGDPIIEDEVNTNGQVAEFIRLNVTSP